MKLIDKDALVAEIERRKKYYENIQMIKPVYESNIEDFSELLSFIKTLEVKEVDFEKETKKWWKEHLHLNPENKLWMDAHQSVVFAKHFFELGFMHTLSWKDIRLIAEIGEEFMSSEESDAYTNEESYYNAILNKLKEKGLDYKTQRQEILDIKALKGEEA